jgi:hypothetical protein
MAAYNFLISRMLTLPLNTEQQHSEWMQILHSPQQQHPQKHVNRTQTQDTTKHLPNKTVHTRTPNNRTKWATFTFSSLQVRKITNIFIHAGIKIAFKCDKKVKQSRYRPGVAQRLPRS